MRTGRRSGRPVFPILVVEFNRRRTRISVDSQTRSETPPYARDSGEEIRAPAHAHDRKFREAD
jgi:hypothetical protein